MREMLQHAAAAAAEVFAARRHAVGRRLDDAYERGLEQLAAALSQPDLDRLARQRVRHEHAAAVDVRDTMAVVGEVEDPIVGERSAPSAGMSRRAPGLEEFAQMRAIRLPRAARSTC